MEDVVLKAELNESTSLYVSPIAKQTYQEHIHDDNLGGENGYFIVRSRKSGATRLEVLAKAVSLEAAEDLFDLIVSSQRAASF